MSIVSAVNGLVRKTRMGLKVNSPKIKVGIGIGVGVVAAVWACYQTYKAQPIFEELEEDKKANAEECGEETKKLAVENRKAYFKAMRRLAVMYIGPAATGVAAGSLIFWGFDELNGRFLGAVATAGALQDTLTKYRARVADKIGVQEEADLYHGVTYKDLPYKDPETGKDKTLPKAPVQDGEALGPFNFPFMKYDPNSCCGSTYYTEGRNDLNLLFLKNAQRNATDRLRTRGWMTVAELMTDYLHTDIRSLKNVSPVAAMTNGWIADSDVSDDFIDLGIWTAYNDFVNCDATEYAANLCKTIMLNLNAVPLFAIDDSVENRLTKVLEGPEKIGDGD